MFQVRAPGLRTDFPPLKTLDATPGNLKPQTTSFVGREMAIAELETASREPAGDLDRCRWGRKDAAGSGGRRAP